MRATDTSGNDSARESVGRSVAEQIDSLARHILRAEALVRNVPQLIDRLREATAAAEAAAAKLDERAKSVGQALTGYTQALKAEYEQSREQLTAGKDLTSQMSRLLSRAGEVFAVLHAVVQAVETSGQPVQAETSPDLARRSEGKHGELTRFVERTLERATTTTASANRQPGSADGTLDPDAVPALIEFDPRRAAMAKRVADSQRTSIRSLSKAGPNPAKRT